MAETKILGIVSIVPMGDWNADTEYQKLNFVRFNGATYLAKKPNINVAPGINAGWQDVWMLCNYDGGQQTVVPDGTYPEMTVGKVQHALFWGNKSYDGSSPQTITAEDLGIASVYKPQGSIEFAMLPAIPSQETEGYIWNITDNFTTDSRFLEGTGVSYSAGTNVGVIQNNGAYYYDVFGNFVDLSDYAKIYGTYPEMTVGNATNVTTQINGKFITDIFETDGTTVKTATNSPKSLYNLGAYDTYVDNGDGTVTVTRKTWYYKIDGNFTANYIWDDFKNMISVEIPNVDYDTPLVASIKTSQNVWNNGNPVYDYAIEDHISNDEGHGVRLVVKNATSQQEFRDYVSQHPIYIQYELAPSEQRPETIIAETPINTIDANMSDIVRDEVEKTLNLADWDGTEDYTKNQNTWTYLFIAKVDIGKNYYFTINNFTQSRVGYGGLFLCQNDTTEIPVLYQNLIGSEYQIQTWEYSANGNLAVNFTPSKEYVLLGFSTDGSTKTIHVEDIMLVEGSHAYPYQPYNGAIVHEKQLHEALEDLKYVYSLPVGVTDNNPEYLQVDDPWLETHSYIGSAFTANVWKNLINIRHRGGEGDGNLYGLQISSNFGESLVSFRYQTAGTWSDWLNFANQEWVKDNYLPLTGGNMSGNVLFGGTVDGGNYYLSMGRGSRNGAGLHGVKIIVQHGEVESGQEFTSGFGQDLLLPDGNVNELDIVTCSENKNNAQNQGIIAFLHHYDNTPSDYSLLGYIDRDGNLRMQGQVIEQGQRVYSPNNEPPYPVTSRVRFRWMNTRGLPIGECVFTIGGKITSLKDLIYKLYAGGYRSVRNYYPVFTMVCLDTTTPSVLQNSDFDTPVKGIYVYNYSSAIIGAVGADGRALESFNSGVTIDTKTFSVKQV